MGTGVGNPPFPSEGPSSGPGGNPTPHLPGITLDSATLIHTSENQTPTDTMGGASWPQECSPGCWEPTLVTVSTCIRWKVLQESQISLELSRTYVLQESLKFISSGCMCLPEHLGLLGGGHSHCPCESLLVKDEGVLPIVAQAPEASSALVSLKLTAQGFLEGVKAWLAPGRDLSPCCSLTLAPLRLRSKRDYPVLCPMEALLHHFIKSGYALPRIRA